MIRRREDGQGLVEYSLIILFVAIALVGTLTAYGVSLSTFYSTVSDMFGN
jgi:Flp pilus assembly pilin Flp